MKAKPAYFVFSPGENHICHLKNVFDSIARTISIDYHFCVLLPSKTCKVASKYPVITKVISKEHEDLCKSLYFQEGRADIKPFAAYSQLFLPYYFDETDDFLFMEVDQIVKGDLAPLLTRCRENDVKIGAVRNIDGNKNYVMPDSFRKNFPAEPYFNMGVVYLNRDYWIRNKLTDLCIEEAKLQMANKGLRYDFYTQGILNNLFSSIITDLKPEFNLTGLGYNQGIAKDLLKSAVILHWNGSRKPWKKDGLYRDLYYGNKQLQLIRCIELAEFIMQKAIKKTVYQIRKMFTF